MVQEKALATWINIVKMIAPIILSVTPLAPIATEVLNAIIEAEQIVGATGPEKLAHVQAIISSAVRAVNLKAGREVVNLIMVQAASTAVIASVIALINLFHRTPTTGRV